MRHTIQTNRGFTYIELIVVLSIFAVMSTVVIFNYNKFQGKVDIKNLSNAIALQIAAAQKSSVSGTLSGLSFPVTDKPSYGVYFNSTTLSQFVYFADLNNSGGCDTTGCTSPYAVTAGGEVQNVINITKGNSIVPATGLMAVGSGCGSPGTPLADLTIVFKRPSPTAMFRTSTALSGCTITDVVMSITSQDHSNSAMIEVYPSGRIQIN